MRIEPFIERLLMASPSTSHGMRCTLHSITFGCTSQTRMSSLATLFNENEMTAHIGVERCYYERMEMGDEQI